MDSFNAVVWLFKNFVSKILRNLNKKNCLYSQISLSKKEKKKKEGYHLKLFPTRLPMSKNICYTSNIKVKINNFIPYPVVYVPDGQKSI